MAVLSSGSRCSQGNRLIGRLSTNVLWLRAESSVPSTSQRRSSRTSLAPCSSSGSSSSSARACREWAFCMKPRSIGLQVSTRAHQPAQGRARQREANRMAAAA